MSRIAEWVIASVVFVAGVGLSSMAMALIGFIVLWEGYGTTSDEARRSWWWWPLLVAPPVLMLLAGLLARRFGASPPIALGAAGVVGVLVGLGYFVVAYLTNL